MYNYNQQQPDTIHIDLADLTLYSRGRDGGLEGPLGRMVIHCGAATVVVVVDDQRGIRDALKRLGVVR